MKGSIRQRGSTWTAYWSTTDPATGKRKQHSKGGFARKEPARPAKNDSAREYLNRIIGDVQDGAWRPDRPLTVRELLEEHWLPAQESRNLRPSTLAQYRGVLDAWIVPHVGAMRAASVTPADVQRLVEKLRTTKTSQGRPGLSPRSLQLTVGVMKAAYAFAVEGGLLARNPMTSVRRPQIVQRVPTTWTAEDARKFLATVESDSLAAMWALLLARGLRRGEAAGLRWEHVGLADGSIRIVHTLVMVQGHVQESVPKTKTGRRTVPLDAHLVGLLTARRRSQAADRLRAGEAWTDSGYVFTNKLGERLSPDWISGRFEDLVRTAKLPRIRLHDTRHTAASIMVATRVPAKVVQEMLGHSHVSITLSLYAHVTPTMGREAGEALSASLLG